MSTKATTSFELSRLQLISLATGDSIDIRLVTLELNVYEDLFSNVVTGDLTISDSNNLISNFPIYGYEWLEITFKSPMDGAMYAKTCRVTNVSNVTPVKERNNVYVVQFSSTVDLTNEGVSVSRAYVQQPISTIVASIARTYLGITNFAILEPTKYLHDYVIPTMDPLTAINFLSTRAVSTSRNGAFYMFYENRNGFNFWSLESAVSQPPVRILQLQPANIRNNPQRNIEDDADSRSIQDYAFETLPDILTNTSVGMYGARLIAHSITQKIYRIHDFDYVKTYPSFKHTEPVIRKDSVATSNNAYTRLGGPGLTSPESLVRLMPFDEDKPITTLSLTAGKPLSATTYPTLPQYTEAAKQSMPGDAGKTPRSPKTIRSSRISTVQNGPTIPQPTPPTLTPKAFTSSPTTTVQSNTTSGYTFTSRQKVERWLLQRDSQRQAMFENIRFTATIPGTVDVTVGDIVEIRLPSVEPVTKENPQKLDKYYSGNYLVANVRHRIAQADNAFFTILECVKDSVYTAYPL